MGVQLEGSIMGPNGGSSSASGHKIVTEPAIEVVEPRVNIRYLTYVSVQQLE